MEFTVRDLIESGSECQGTREAVALKLLTHGWAALDISRECSIDWHETYEKVFRLSPDAKASAGAYRNTQGVAVGYKHDEEREFLECHRLTDGTFTPDFSKSVPEYQEVTQSLYVFLSRCACAVLKGVAAVLELDPMVFLQLTDLSQEGILPSVVTEKGFDPEFHIADNCFKGLSSSVLRVCMYNNTECRRVMFGAHTDTSFLTLGLSSLTPGLEVLDQVTDEWICPELMHGRQCLTVFTGEYLQILTRQRFKAAVHRVAAFSTSIRISCPFLIRGRPGGIVEFDNEDYHHPGGPPVLARDYIPDLDGTPITTVQKLLDLKRGKCSRSHSSDVGDWVLSAYPINSRHFPNHS